MHTVHLLDIHLRDTQTGEVVVYHNTYPIPEPDLHESSTLYIWEEGNYSCDCNRSLFFHRAKHPDADPNDPEIKLDCNTGDNRIIIDKIVVRETGEVLAENL